MVRIIPNSSDDILREVLRHTRVIAVVGCSDKPDHTSYQIAQFLKRVGYRVYPVNPMVSEVDGQPSYPDLRQVPEPIDIVNLFRRSEYLSTVVDEAIAIQAKTIWAQLGVSDPVAGQRAIDAGLNVIMDACIKVEYLRLKPGF